MSSDPSEPAARIDREIRPLPAPLSADVLAARRVLPAKPAGVELVGERVRLRPYEPADAPELHAISNGSPVARLGREIGVYDADELVWRYLFDGPFADAEGLRRVHDAIAAQPDARTFVVAERSSGALLGSISLLANHPAHLKVEIGSIWYTPAVQRTGVGMEVTTLVANHVFGLGYQRFEWKCNALNLRSRLFATRFGFTFEGIQEAHLIVKDRRRDTAWFRLLADEWSPAES